MTRVNELDRAAVMHLPRVSVDAGRGYQCVDTPPGSPRHVSVASDTGHARPPNGERRLDRRELAVRVRSEPTCAESDEANQGSTTSDADAASNSQATRSAVVNTARVPERLSVIEIRAQSEDLIVRRARLASAYERLDGAHDALEERLGGAIGTEDFSRLRIELLQSRRRLWVNWLSQMHLTRLLALGEADAPAPALECRGYVERFGRAAWFDTLDRLELAVRAESLAALSCSAAEAGHASEDTRAADESLSLLDRRIEELFDSYSAASAARRRRWEGEPWLNADRDPAMLYNRARLCIIWMNQQLLARDRPKAGSLEEVPAVPYLREFGLGAGFDTPDVLIEKAQWLQRPPSAFACALAMKFMA